MTPAPPSEDHLDDERLSALLDGELAPEDTDGARSHLSGCGRCRDRFAAFQRVAGLVAGRPAPLDELTAARLVRGASAARPADRGRRALALGAGALAASLLAVAAVGGLVSRRDQGDDLAGTALRERSAPAPEAASDAMATAAPAGEPLDDPAVLDARVGALVPTGEPEPACGPPARAATGAGGALVGSFAGTLGGEPVLVVVLDAGGGRRRALVTGAACALRADVLVSASGAAVRR